MVLSSQTTRERTRHSFSTDKAACWGNLAGAAIIGAGRCKPFLLPNPSVMLGDTETGDMVTYPTLPFWKDEVGRWERCNISPTGGRQYVSDDISSNGSIQGDNLKLKGAVVLRGATFSDRRIAQASNTQKNFGRGVFSCKTEGVSGQNWMDTFRLPRGMEQYQVGKPRVRNICAAKGLRTDCIAKPVLLLVGLHLWETRQKEWITWEVPCYTSNTRFLSGRQGMGEVVIRFKPNEWKLFHKCGVLVETSGRKLPSVKGFAFSKSGKICEDFRHATPSTVTQEVGPLNVSIFCGVTPSKTVVKNAAVSLLPSFNAETVFNCSTPPLSHLANGYLRILGGRFYLHDIASRGLDRTTLKRRGKFNNQSVITVSQFSNLLSESHSDNDNAAHSQHDEQRISYIKICTRLVKSRAYISPHFVSETSDMFAVLPSPLASVESLITR